MIKSISFWSFPSGMSVRDILQTASDLGYDAVELTLEAEGEITMDTPDETIADIKEMADDMGLQLPTFATGLHWEHPVVLPGGEKGQEGIEITKCCLRFAEILGASTVLMVPTTVTPELQYDVAYRVAQDVCRELGPIAAEHGVVVGVENVWNKFLLSPMEFARFIDEIDEEYVGAYFDVGNVLKTGYPEQWIRILNDRIAAVHFKDFRTDVGLLPGFVDLLEGDVDWGAVMTALGEIGYDFAVTAEMMPPYNHYPLYLLEATSGAMDLILGRKSYE